jgi:hypothetical protein
MYSVVDPDKKRLLYRLSPKGIQNYESGNEDFCNFKRPENTFAEPFTNFKIAICRTFR